MSEAQVLADVRRALGTLPSGAFWRNHTGQLRDERGQVHRFGLAVGSADLVGVYHGRFIALECKSSTGRVSKEQHEWMRVVRDAGGFACVVRSADEALAAVERARNGASE